MISNDTLSGNFNNSDDNIDVATFIRFLKQIRFKEMLSKVNDFRQQSKVLYSNHTLLLAALSVFF